MNQNKTWNTTWSNYPSEMEMINQEKHRSRQRFQSFRFLRGTSISRSHFERFPTLCREYLVTVPTNGVDRSNPPPVPRNRRIPRVCDANFRIHGEKSEGGKVEARKVELSIRRMGQLCLANFVSEK